MLNHLRPFQVGGSDLYCVRKVKHFILEQCSFESTEPCNININININKGGYVGNCTVHFGRQINVQNGGEV